MNSFRSIFQDYNAPNKVKDTKIRCLKAKGLIKKAQSLLYTFRENISAYAKHAQPNKPNSGDSTAPKEQRIVRSVSPRTSRLKKVGTQSKYQEVGMEYLQILGDLQKSGMKDLRTLLSDTKENLSQYGEGVVQLRNVQRGEKRSNTTLALSLQRVELNRSNVKMKTISQLFSSPVNNSEVMETGSCIDSMGLEMPNTPSRIKRSVRTIQTIAAGRRIQRLRTCK